MMQNLTLPTSQTLALGATLNAIVAVKSSANANASTDKTSPTEPNASFEMMLSKQVKVRRETIEHKPAQHKEAQAKQSDDSLIDASASIVQMVGDAKALLASDNGSENLVLGKKVEKALAEETLERAELTNGSLINAENPTLSSEVLALALTPSIAPVANKAIARNAKENQSLKLDASATTNKDIVLANTLSEFNNTQIKTLPSDQMNSAPSNFPIPTQFTTQNDTGISQVNLDASDTDSQQDRLLWASVSAAKPNQNSELVNGNALLNIAKDTEMPRLSDIVNNLVIPTNLQNQASQPNAVLPINQLGYGNQINAYPGRAGWDQAISQKIVWMVGAAEQTATLTLNPPDLGPLQVVINVRNDMADTTFISGNAEVRQALQDGMANLREKMAESGIQLGQANVNSGDRPKQEFQQAILNQKSSEFNRIDSTLPTETTMQKGSVGRINNGLVDTFA